MFEKKDKKNGVSGYRTLARVLRSSITNDYGNGGIYLLRAQCVSAHDGGFMQHTERQ